MGIAAGDEGRHVLSGDREDETEQKGDQARRHHPKGRTPRSFGFTELSRQT
jgi:hypothetical protein